MLHLGDIAKINGAEVPAVNVIIGGSPCQDLSVAGKRAGLSGERSGLFMEQLRIIKEMRRKDIENGAVIPRPRYMVWENVPGAFSSNKGRDFKTVLEETIGVVTEVKPDIPIPKEGWHYSGCIMGEGFSLAWRVFDAQFWGVPQRRRRIALVADFGGFTAPEILFERDGVSGNITQSGTPWKDFATIIAKRFGSANQTERGADPTDSENTQLIYDALGNGDLVCEGFPLGFRPENVRTYKEKSATICNGTRPGFCNGVIALDRAAFNQGENAQYDFEVSENGVNSTLTAKGPSAICESIVRRLSPLECERLQGFPDGWTDIGDYIDTKGKKRKTSDSARYKALGNSIALPSWVWVLERLARCCRYDYTMASLFDGIGGFPLIWETLNGKGTCLWASEIDEFPIAVTKRRFS